ncbi:nose resistant to fluoxetine protein 6-like [Cydia pomonella]|uniref:nose resistant to fluoxetine protein 6-like n=1 Tax=Cydia pomonella TaxID=82600 RepID=UPI002ADE8371|nr:nose resistant to fluoxetine protein 6-like [Cydia pomonella]XP_061720717.1 nose resistant to fluoxetine protein 6-like [Cydia pomonella]XP_061720718.1 nose resistant to fluoxetine protein 6-like [Cydia pomonella]XP_061720719.1 nose resistant to fluoxetine protein 6-like [Cydia pomonella]XP_061720720.1 nose resistant to fluoxetine protein 6-like [Cydia pomonella]XP_061720721.1 nose resistant to fluoxetine protein 6-like [Cydia pomonella]
MLRLVVFGLVLRHSTAVIYKLTPQEYDVLPKLTNIDEYAPCMRVPGDAYCFVSAELHGNLSDPLYHMLVEYSANTITHFDHTHIHRGICPKKTCVHHMHTSTNLTKVVETCLNETLTRDYSLTAKIFEAHCEEYSKELKLDSGDYAFVVVIFGVLVLNSLGSFYDFFCEHGKNTFVGRYVLCFSVRRNWQRLAAPGSSSPMQRRIKSIHSFRTITALLVIIGHSPIPSLLVGKDPQFMEETYHNISFHLFFNGTLIVQTFFMISGFLMAYNMLLSEQKRPPSWLNLPKGVLLRWLRLTPPYALVMLFVMTWMRHLSSGPFYLKSVTSEAVACHRDWWQHLLYIHNYIDHSQCMAHAWYLGAEFQLSIVGLLVFCVLHSNRIRKMVIGAVMVVGLITPAVHTYVQDLHAVLIVSPEVALNFFVEDPTFNNLYKRGHTNLVCYGLGLAMAYAVYNLTDSDLGAKKFKAYLPLYWSLFPIMLVIVLTGYVFYIDGIIIPICVRVVYSSAIKFIFGFVTAVFIYLTIVKTDRAFRGFLNWGGWARISRLTYFAYLVHIPILRFGIGNVDELVPIGVFWLLTNLLSCICMAYSLAVPLFITVESPLAELVKVALVPQAKPAAKASKKMIVVKL